jgi:hypothetical protein
LDESKDNKIRTAVAAVENNEDANGNSPRLCASIKNIYICHHYDMKATVRLNIHLVINLFCYVTCKNLWLRRVRH